jgi:hypothetical protein
MNNAVWHNGYRDPVEGGTVSFLPVIWGCDAGRVARLYYQLALTYRLSPSEISTMSQLAAYGIDTLDDDFVDDLKKIEERIEQARRDDERLRALRAKGGGTLDEVLAILERTHEGLRWQMQIDPAHREEIAAKLAASEQHIRKKVVEDNRAVRRQLKEQNGRAKC